MSWNHAAVGAVAAVVLVAAVDGVRSGGGATTRADRDDGRYVIDLHSSRGHAPVPVAELRAAFPAARASAFAVSKVAVAPDETSAVAVSSVSAVAPGRAAIQLWREGRLVRTFRVPAGSFSRGLWFAGGGRFIATVGWDGRGYLYEREGRPAAGIAYFAYETG